MAATLMFFALAERYPQRRRLFLALMYVSVGLGVLTKGPVAVALPGLVFLIYLLAHKELRRVTKMMIPAGIAIVLAIVVPWYAALYERDGWTHIASFFVGENLGRFSEGSGSIRPRSVVLPRRPLQRRLPLGADAVPSRGSVVARPRPAHPPSRSALRRAGSCTPHPQRQRPAP